MFYRLIKPSWAIKTIKKGDTFVPNPDFVKEIPCKPKTIEGCLTEDEVKQLNAIGYNAYWFPNHPATNVYESGIKYLSGKMIDVFNYVFVDMDSKEGIYTVDEFIDVLAKFPIKPTMTVKSGHGVHAYWRMANLSREEYIMTQFALLRAFKTDDSVWTVLQLMRVPDSLNTKEVNNFRQTEIVKEVSTGQVYNNIGVFPKEIFNLSDEDKTKAQNHINKLLGIAEVNIIEDVDLTKLPDSFIRLMQQKPIVKRLFEDPVGTHGDRSGADMKLTNILFSSKISKKDAMVVIANTQKAISKGAYRLDYAASTIDKAYVDRVENKFMTVGQKLKMGVQDKPKEYVRGPFYFDCLIKKWSKKQILGLVGGSGIGKTAVTLNIIRAMIENNFEANDDVFVFFSLEMPESEIMERWIELVGENSPLADRLYVIGNEDENDNPRNIGLQEVYEYCTDIKTQTGKEIGCVAIDHIGIIGKHIDTRKKYTFGIESEQGAGWSDIRTLSLASLCTQLKTLAKMLNTFVIPLTQTTKDKGVGYTPLGKDAAYGVSQYENIVDYMITLWQPLQLIQEMTETRFLGWQYAKIRHMHKDDPIKANSYKLLTYDLTKGDLTLPTEEEYKEFARLLPLALERAKEKEKKVETAYSRPVSKEVLQGIRNKLHLVSPDK